LYSTINRRLIKLDIQSIHIIEARGYYIRIKPKNQRYIFHTILKKNRRKLSQAVFLKVHWLDIIHVNKVIDIEGNSVLVVKDVILVNRSNCLGLMRIFNFL